MHPQDLRAHPNLLAPHYSRFRVAERVLLTGHSHQAWPDRARDGLLRSFDDAADRVDGKWEPAFQAAERVREGYARLLDDHPGNIALSASTHDLLVRWLSALPLREKPRVVTTTGEFHAIRRQLARLEEEGLEVVRVPVDPVDSLAERVASEVDDQAAAALISSVLFENARIVPGLDRLAEACRRTGVPLLVDAYHHLNVVPFSIRELGLEDAFVTGGGYKYCQLGEGNGFLRFPPDTTLRPVITGWFAEFGAVVLGEDKSQSDLELHSRGVASDPAPEGPGRHVRGPVAYGPGPARFAGATYDPASHYRGAEVFAFFRDEGLDPAFLREVSRHQVGLLAEGFDALDLDPRLVTRDRSQPLEETGGFLALRSAHAGRLEKHLRERGVWTDHRNDILRLGPAPYLSDRQIQDGLAALGEAVQRL
jgi:kynureninase